VRQVDYLPELYEDVRSKKYRIVYELYVATIGSGHLPTYVPLNLPTKLHIHLPQYLLTAGPSGLVF